MPELTQCACGNSNRLPILVSDFPSGLPRFPVAPPRPQHNGKLEEPEAMDEPLNPFVPEATDGLLDSHITELTDENIDSHITVAIDGHLNLSNPVANEPLDSHAPEAMDNLIDHYIPAGVLGNSALMPRFPDSDVEILEKDEWIRTRALNNSDNVQIFVLPDAQRTHLKSKVKLISALKRVMSKIDRSAEAWYGVIPANASLLINPQPDSEEEESLYYIYNTLQQPKADLNLVKDPNSRNVMRELLDDSVRGLETTLYDFQRESAAAMVQRETQPALALDPRFQHWRGPTGLEFYFDKVKGRIVRNKILYPEACGGEWSYIHC
ncbi:uncharacterized protein N7500_002189 [Penicillium coprophilum]|uniref:uncharacterized protein n=1 Tax=Penicillium coprophilum TaxID=36646 RepID=UPI00239A7D37|nr:uncharacterized protein N7500_002189 [Penicillium coprophilum]KAJ5169406.1 hypothetical protein N7500_002189 [Penicillium coprophilum]